MSAHAKDVKPDPTPPVSLAERFSRRAEKIITAPELGAVVIIKEARVGDILPIVQAFQKDPVLFGRKIVALTVTIDGEALTEEIQADMGMQQYKKLAEIMPQVMKINGMDTEATAPNV